MSRLHDVNTEASPLVVKLTEKDKGDKKGQATVVETILNLCKTCCGTGCLALPYAAQSGGVLVFGIGLLFLGLWNLYAVERLVRCRAYLVEAVRVGEEEQEEESQRRVPATVEMESKPRRMKFPKESTSTLGKVAFFAFGPAGLEVMDILMTILLLGIVISYLSAVISFLSDTPVTIGPLGDAFVIASLMAVLSLVPDLGHLSGISGVGLLVLAGAFIVIASYGLYGFLEAPNVSLPLWPASAVGLSHFFGVCVFGFGTVPLTYNFQESMKKPSLIIPTTAGALGCVALFYIVLGVGLSILYPNVEGEILHELPGTGWLPTVTRLAMAVVVVLTAPLLIVPTGELLEGKFHDNKVLVRCGVCLVSVCVAVLLPTFVQVLAFVGCACVGFVSFCVPPILHIRIVWMLKEDKKPPNGVLLLDVVMLVWGLIATTVGTIYTLG
mmetsp:Transcript_14921/g.28492  ORF Transcript_14921/g.28492 Transcript_14921/m.28492 type:complete len:440 (-) Transcript_14921:107-1426(-)